jgi:hypothetical protein
MERLPTSCVGYGVAHFFVARRLIWTPLGVTKARRFAGNEV